MRDTRIELFRCACMFGVVLLHALTQGGYADAHRGLDNLMTPSVVGFVFISGYFGIKCRVKGALKSLVIGLSCWIILAMLNMIFTSSFGIGGYWWFLWMYLALMAMAPLVDPMFSQRLDKGVIAKIAPFVIVVYVWSYAATKVPMLKDVVPPVDGFSPFGVLTFFAVYLVARASRIYEDKIKTWWLMVVAVLSGAICWIGFYHYNSPFSLLFAGSMFYLFKRLPSLDRHRFLSSIVFWISPSMFPVYLLHTNTRGFNALRRAEDYLMSIGWNYYAMSFSIAIGIFVACILLDIPRRVMDWAFRKKFANSSKR